MTLKADDLIPVDDIEFMDEDLRIGLVKTIMNSEQYKYSEELLDLRYDNGLSLQDMVHMTELTKHEYLSLECSDMTIDVGEYKEAINKVNNKLKEWGALND